MHQFAISSVWTDWTTMRWMPCLWQNSLSHLNTAVMQPDRWCVKQTRDTVTWTSARISRRSSVQVSGERSQMPESSRWGSTSTWSFPSMIDDSSTISLSLNFTGLIQYPRSSFQLSVRLSSAWRVHSTAWFPAIEGSPALPKRVLCWYYTTGPRTLQMVAQNG